MIKITRSDFQLGHKETWYSSAYQTCLTFSYNKNRNNTFLIPRVLFSWHKGILYAYFMHKYCNEKEIVKFLISSSISPILDRTPEEDSSNMPSIFKAGPYNSWTRFSYRAFSLGSFHFHYFLFKVVLKTLDNLINQSKLLDASYFVIFHHRQELLHFIGKISTG